MVLPTGAVHIAIRLGDQPLRLFAHARDTVGYTVGCASLSGARACAYIKDLSNPAPTVGILLRPGAAQFVAGVPAHELAGVHTPLDAVWGSAACSLRDRLGEAGSADARLDIMEAALAARVRRIRGIHPAIADALVALGNASDVGSIVARTGHSHRHFIKLFSEAVGLTPKLYGRVVRFGRVLERFSHAPASSWADVAAAAGYADQPHLNRDFREFTGMSPDRYRRLAAGSAHHVPL
nr:helix-turn-helix domain-containing protein [Reyranella sp. CPCC 100927]